MSFDLFLFRLDPDADFDTARVLLDNLSDKKAADPAFDARDAVDALLRIEPRYRRIDLNYAALARARGTSEDAVRRDFDFIQVDGPVDLPMAQFSFHRATFR